MGEWIVDDDRWTTKATWATERVARPRVRMCANRVVAGVRMSTDLPINCPQDPHQFALAQQIDQLEGLAPARA